MKYNDIVDVIKNILVGSTAITVIVVAEATGEYLRAHNLTWIVGIPFAIFLYILVAAGVGFLLRSFYYDVWKKR